MPGKIKTIPELQRELIAKRSLLRRLRAQRRKLATRTAALDRRIAAIDGGAGPSPKRKKRKKRVIKKRRKKAAKKKAVKRGSRRKGKSLVAYIAKVLAAKKDGMRIKEVVAAVKKAGYKTKSKDFRGIVSATLRTDNFNRIKRGVYALK